MTTCFGQKEDYCAINLTVGQRIYNVHCTKRQILLHYLLRATEIGNKETKRTKGFRLDDSVGLLSRRVRTHNLENVFSPSKFL